MIMLKNIFHVLKNIVSIKYSSPADTRAFSAEPCNEEATFVYYTFMLYTYFPSQNHLLTRCQHRGTIFTA